MANQRIVRNLRKEVLTIQEAFNGFIREKQADNLAAISITGYKDSFNCFMRWFEFNEDTELSVITEEMFTDWKASMLESELKTSSINHYLRCIKVFLNWCSENNHISSKIKITFVKGQDETFKAFPDDDLARITTKPTNIDDFTEWRTWTIIMWILATGNRAGTICSIKLGDLDFRNKEIVLSHTKNKKAQVIPLSSTLEHIIKDYIRTWRYNTTADDYLFPNVANEQLTVNALRLAFYSYCKSRGSSHTNIHGLRHSFALNWIRNGGNEFKLQRILGHSTLEMTRRYVALAVADLKKDYECFTTLDNLKKPRKPRYVITKTI